MSLFHCWRKGHHFWNNAYGSPTTQNKSFCSIFTLQTSRCDHEPKIKFVLHIYCISNRFRSFGVNCIFIILLPHQRLPSLLHCGLIVEYVHSYYIMLSVKLGFAVLGIFWFSGQKQTSLLWLFKEFLHLSTMNTIFFKLYLNVVYFTIQRMFFAFWKHLKESMVPINNFLSK